jgi:hypothetical protein
MDMMGMMPVAFFRTNMLKQNGCGGIGIDRLPSDRPDSIPLDIEPIQPVLRSR